jgi:hypothetical protein
MVYVFKTTVKSRTAVKQIGSALNKMPWISRWNFDLQDCDKILRIEAGKIDTTTICKLVKAQGFDCMAL